MEATISSLLLTIQKDQAASPYVRSLYAAILTCWQQQGFPAECRISRSLLMPLSGIRSFATYHKCLRSLIGRGYIGYESSYHNRLASTVTLPGSETWRTIKQQGGEQ